MPGISMALRPPGRRTVAARRLYRHGNTEPAGRHILHLTAAGDIDAVQGLRASPKQTGGLGNKRRPCCFIGNPHNSITPWDLNPHPKTCPRNGDWRGSPALMPPALATRGIAVTVLEAATHASGGSSSKVWPTLITPAQSADGFFSVGLRLRRGSLRVISGSGALEPGVDYGWAGTSSLTTRRIPSIT